MVQVGLHACVLACLWSCKLPESLQQLACSLVLDDLQPVCNLVFITPSLLFYLQLGCILLLLTELMSCFLLSDWQVYVLTDVRRCCVAVLPVRYHVKGARQRVTEETSGFVVTQWKEQRACQSHTIQAATPAHQCHLMMTAAVCRCMSLCVWHHHQESKHQSNKTHAVHLDSCWWLLRPTQNNMPTNAQILNVLPSESTQRQFIHGTKRRQSTH